MRKRIALFLACFMMASLAFAQTRVTGTVISAEDGEPIPGASVLLEGTRTGVVTNADGQFALTVPSDVKRLEVSCQGMIKQLVRVRPVVKVEMAVDEHSLDEVMVIAYGTQKRAAFTGSASVVGADEIQKVQTTNFADAIKGKATGVQISTASGQPGTTPTIRIRGYNSLQGGMDPLIVVDGVPYDGSLNDINPVDIESVTVQKDAASSALYGARGGNGVIMVTTKSAKKGKDATITFDAKWGVNTKGDVDYEMITSPAGYYETYYKKLYNYATAAQTGGIGSGLGYDPTRAWQWVNQNMIPDTDMGLRYNVYNVPEGQYLIGQNGKLNPGATLGNVVTGADGNQYLLVPDNWQDEIYHNSLRQEYTVSASGASDRGTFYASANYLNHDGITYATGYERFSGRLKADYQVKKWLKVGANMTYNHFNRDRMSSDNEGSWGNVGNIFALRNIAPIYPMFYRDATGKILYNNVANVLGYDYGETTYVGLVRPYMNGANPISDLLVDTYNNEGNSFNGVATADIYLPYGFTFTSTNATYLYESRVTQVTNPYFGQYKSSNGLVYKSHSRQWDYDFQQRLNWHKIYGQHDIEAMIAHDYYRQRSYGISGQRHNMLTQTNKELAGAVVLDDASSEFSEYNTESFMARVMYNYADKYFVYGSVMRQGSSAFHPDHRWGTFWSASAGWMISKENWFKAKWVDELKLKVSYGENGNDENMRYAYYYTNRYAIVNNNNKISLTPSSRKGNEELTWEKNGRLNAGFDFSFFGQRLYGTLEYYNNRTKDMLASFPYPATLGYTSAIFNVGNMTNHGVEVELHADLIRTKDFKWNVYANASYNYNKITKLAEERKTQEYDGYFGYSSGSRYYTEGKSMYTYFGKSYAGVYNEETYKLAGDEAYDPTKGGLAMYWKNRYKTDADGNVMKDDKGAKIVEEKYAVFNQSEADNYVGEDLAHKVFGGFGTGFEFKGFDLSVDFQYALGGKVFDDEYQTLMTGSAGYGIHKDVLKSWTPENSGSNIPRFQYGYNYGNSGCDRWLINASYLTLGNITFGYTIDKRILKTPHIQSIRIYGAADNVYTWSKRRGLDPRQYSASDPGSANGLMYSPIRTVSFGLNVTF